MQQQPNTRPRPEKQLPRRHMQEEEKKQNLAQLPRFETINSNEIRLNEGDLIRRESDNYSRDKLIKFNPSDFDESLSHAEPELI